MLIYGFGAIVIKAIAFFTLPIYTRIFSPSEFGIIEMFSTIATILSIFMTMGLDRAQSFYFMEAKNKKIEIKRNNYFYTCFKNNCRSNNN